LAFHRFYSYNELLMKIKKQNLFIVNELPVNIDINIDIGLYLLTGENGIGKTSFFNFLKENNQTPGSDSEIAFMDQFPLSPINEIRLSDIISFFNKGNRPFDCERAYQLIDRYEIAYLLDRAICLYSGGENQIVKFILMYCQNVDYYFLDEPLQYVDQLRVDKMKQDLKELSTTKAVVIIEHRGEYLDDLNPSRIKMVRNQQVVELYGY